MWFEKWFSSKFYLELYQHRNDEDARLMINLLQRTIPVSTNAKILDIACGAGRHSLELARRGFDVTGFDLSKFLINEAKKNLRNSKERNLKAKFLIRDMRSFDFKNSFDIAVNMFTSFGYFPDDKENFKVIENVSSSLKNNGYFVFDFINDKYLRKHLVPSTIKKHDGSTLIQKRFIKGGFVFKKIQIKSSNETLEFEEVLKLYSYSELKKVFGSYGLKFEKAFGDYFGNKFNETNSQRLIIFAKKV